VSGVRRLRIHNLRLQATANKMDVFRTVDLDTLMNVYSKEAIHQLLHAGKNSNDIREMLATKCARILGAYRVHCASNSNPSELVLPEQMKLMPLYCNSLSNSDIISFGEFRLSF
jgi:protein transport protein SEC24